MRATIKTSLLFHLIAVTLVAQGVEPSYSLELRIIEWLPYVVAALVVTAVSLAVIATCAVGVYRSVVVIRYTVTALKDRKEPAIKIELIEHD